MTNIFIEFWHEYGLDQISKSQWIVSFASGISLWMSVRYFLWYIKKKRVQALIDLKTVQRKEQIVRLKSKLASLDQEGLWKGILCKSYEELKEALREGSLKSVDVLRAYQWKALESTAKLNNIVWFIEKAEEDAKRLDELPEDQRGPLHGIPMSIKECFNVKNCDSTAGMCQFVHQPSETDGLSVKTVKSFGGVPFCMTNVPQSMYSLQCSNPVYGSTGNALDAQREAGGSSGGEGSLIGSGGSILGIGSDVGGSLRNPAIFNGIFSLKPSYGRHLSTKGTRPPTKYENVGFNVVGGFMASTTSALVDSYKALFDLGKQNLEDPNIAPIKWQPELFESKKKLRIGFYLSHGLYLPHPGCSRAVREAANILRQQGHELIEFHSPPEEKIKEIYIGLLFQDRLVHFRDAINRDVIIDRSMSAIYAAAFTLKLPNIFLSWLVNPIASLFTRDILPKPLDSGADIMKAVHDRDQLLMEYLKEWDELGLDLIMTPASLLPAPMQGIIGDMPSATRPYTAWNIFNMPAGIVPITKVVQEDDLALPSLPNDDLFYKYMKKSCKGAIGQPLGVQIVGRRFQEELVLSLMAELEHLSKLD